MVAMPEAPRAARDAHGDLAAVGDQQAVERPHGKSGSSGSGAAHAGARRAHGGRDALARRAVAQQAGELERRGVERGRERRLERAVDDALGGAQCGGLGRGEQPQLGLERRAQSGRGHDHVGEALRRVPAAP